MWNDLEKSLRSKMDKTIQSCVEDIEGIRAGKAHPSLVQHILVNVYGSNMKVSDLANISTPSLRVLTIEPWDHSNISAINKALREAENLGLDPSVDGHKIRITVPELSEERRSELVKLVSQKCEFFKVAIRNIRRGYIDIIKSKEKGDECSEDESKNYQTKVQKVTDEFIDKTESLLKNKKKDIMGT